MRSKHELLFKLLLEDAGATGLQVDFKFHPTRKWALDIVHIGTLTGIEIDGGEFARKSGRGSHNRGAQMARDYEKRNEALLLGWRVFQLTGQQVQYEGRIWAQKIAEWINPWHD